MNTATSILEAIWTFIVLAGGLTLIITAIFMVVIWVTDIAGELISRYRERKIKKREGESLTPEQREQIKWYEEWKKRRFERKDERGDPPDHES